MGRDFSFGDGPGGLRESLYGKHQPFIGAYFPDRAFAEQYATCISERADFTGDRLGGLPIIVTNHRERSAFNLCPYQGDESGLRPVIAYSYDREKILPYRYQVYLDNEEIDVDFAPSHQSAVYSLTFEKEGSAYLVFNSRNGQLQVKW